MLTQKTNPDVFMMENKWCWPVRAYVEGNQLQEVPVLMLHRGEEKGYMVDLHIYDTYGYDSTVFFMGDYNAESVKDYPKEVYDTKEEIYEAGWRVTR